ncbi:STAS domain-containing protein [Krasilnikovia sp. MM14-A1259]|uniref:STAS domain-containing protein n=1 Tax=Krasilnikovia sp. MM14-A1259 TaxID=3373539 RepID=UPI0037F7C053
MRTFGTTSHTPQLVVQAQEESSSAATVTVTGEVDTDTQAEMQRVVVDLLDHHRGGRLVLDMGGVTFLDAAGVRALLACHDAAERLGTGLEICAAHDCVRRALGICGVAEIFHLQGV